MENFTDEELRQALGMSKARGVVSGTKRAPYATKKIETVTINFRVPKMHAEACKDAVRPIIKNKVKELSSILPKLENGDYTDHLDGIMG